MRFFSLIAATLAAATVYASAVPRNVNDVAAAVKDQLTFHVMDGDDDACPDLKVLCVKKNDDGADEVVGDIGKQSFCHKGGLSCGQCHTKTNEAKCNTKFPVACKLKCYTKGSPI